MVLQEKGVYDVIFNERKLKIYSENGKIVIGDKTFYPQISTRFTSKDNEHDYNSYLVQIEDYSFKIEYIDGRTYINGREVDFSFRISIKKIERKFDGVSRKQTIIYAMIPGIVTGIPVTIGQQVEKDQPILYLEAMKMRNEIRAPIQGKIESINLSLNQRVSKGDLLLVITPVD